jgi:hypothetical protein
VANIVDLQSVKDILWDPGTPESINLAFDNLLEDLIADITAEAEDEIDLKLEAVTSKVVYRSGKHRCLWLDHMNISSVSIWVDSDELFAPGTLVPADHYLVHTERGYVERRLSDSLQISDWWYYGSGSFGGHHKVKIQYNGGYSESTLVKSLKRALITQTVYRFRRRKDVGLSSVTYPGGSVNKFTTDQWLPEVLAVLNKFKRVSL